MVCWLGDEAWILLEDCFEFEDEALIEIDELLDLGLGVFEEIFVGLLHARDFAVEDGGDGEFVFLEVGELEVELLELVGQFGFEMEELFAEFLEFEAVLVVGEDLRGFGVLLGDRLEVLHELVEELDLAHNSNNIRWLIFFYSNMNTYSSVKYPLILSADPSTPKSRAGRLPNPTSQSRNTATTTPNCTRPSLTSTNSRSRSRRLRPRSGRSLRDKASKANPKQFPKSRPSSSKGVPLLRKRPSRRKKQSPSTPRRKPPRSCPSRRSSTKKNAASSSASASSPKNRSESCVTPSPAIH